jgi:hypothetical protein
MVQGPSDRSALRRQLVLVAIVFVVAALYKLMQGAYSAEWTGFGPHIPPASGAERVKTLWHWLQLLIPLSIPLAIGYATLRFNERNAWTTHETTHENQREAALQAYLEQMGTYYEGVTFVRVGLRTVHDGVKLHVSQKPPFLRQSYSY